MADSPDSGPARATVPSGVPTDHTTLTNVLDRYAETGFSGSFEIDAEQIRCLACDRRKAIGRYEMSSLRRMEGASDPDDMLAVVALTCPACGAQGTLVVNFGPQASAEEAAVLAEIRHAETAGTPRHSAPGEALGDTTAS